MRLKGKIIIVTGSCTGIGKAIAKRCVQEGASVVIHGLEDSLGQQLCQELGTENTVLSVQDITESGAPQNLVALCLERFGKLDAIVNNAALVASSNVETTDPHFLRKILEVNTVAPFALIKAAVPYLKTTQGTILNIGSVNAYCGEPNLLAYSMSKGALMTMTRNLGDALFRDAGVRVNQINPGWVLTESEAIRKREHGLADDWYKDLPAAYAPSGRIFSPGEIAAAAMYWLSDESGPVSGQVMDIEQYPFIGRNPPKDSTTIP